MNEKNSSNVRVGSTPGQRMTQDLLLSVISHHGAQYLFSEGAVRNDEVLLWLGLITYGICGFSSLVGVANLYLHFYPPNKQ